MRSLIAALDSPNGLGLATNPLIRPPELLPGSDLPPPATGRAEAQLSVQLLGCEDARKKQREALNR